MRSLTSQQELKGAGKEAFQKYDEGVKCPPKHPSRISSPELFSPPRSRKAEKASEKIKDAHSSRGTRNFEALQPMGNTRPRPAYAQPSCSCWHKLKLQLTNGWNRRITSSKLAWAKEQDLDLIGKIGAMVSKFTNVARW